MPRSTTEQTGILDHDFEASARRLPEHAARARAWRGDAVRPGDCVISLDHEDNVELHGLVESMLANPLPIWLRRVEQFPLPRLRDRMTRARRLLDGTPGVAVIDALPMDDLLAQGEGQGEGDADPSEESPHAHLAHAVFWVLGQLIGRPVAQKWNGAMLYDVRDTGDAYGYGVRGSHTSVELVFHTDNAFAVAPPDYVGLMCFNPAREGGLSRFCSLYTIHEELRARFPQALERLYQPMLWDRQAEHASGAPKVLRAPMFRCEGDRLLTRANISLVRKGYQVAAQEPDAALVEALAAVETVSEDPSLWFEMPIARGHLQFLNNVDTAHYRSEFMDHEEPDHRRHLVRSWHRDRARPCYDG